MNDKTLDEMADLVTLAGDKTREIRADLAVNSLRWLKHNVLNYQHDELEKFWAYFMTVLLDADDHGGVPDFEKWYDQYVDAKLN